MEYCLQPQKLANIEKLERELAAASEDFRRDLGQSQWDSARHPKLFARRTMLVDLLEYTHCTPPGKTGTVAVFDARLVAFVVRRINRSKESNSSRSPSRSPPGGYSLDLGCDRRNSGRRTRCLVWDKLQPQLSGAKTVLISPDGATARGSLAGTARSEAGNYLIEDVGIAVVPIPRLLPELLAADEPAAETGTGIDVEPSLFLLGDVDFDSDPGKPSLQSLAQGSPQQARGAMQPLVSTAGH